MQGKHDLCSALRGAELLEQANKLGIGLDRLESLIKLTERIASERQTGGDILVGASLELIRLEAQTNKTPHQIVQNLLLSSIAANGPRTVRADRAFPSLDPHHSCPLPAD